MDKQPRYFCVDCSTELFKKGVTGPKPKRCNRCKGRRNRELVNSRIPKANCKNCGNEFQPTMTGYGRPSEHCSMSCVGNTTAREKGATFWDKEPDRICSNCGKSFRPNQNRKKLCSRACAGEVGTNILKEHRDNSPDIVQAGKARKREGVIREGAWSYVADALRKESNASGD